MLIPPTSDPMGQAILDYVTKGQALHKLVVKSSMFDDDEMPVGTLFRTEQEMPALERTALNLCQGSTLDVGAGAGCHTLALESRGLDVTSIDISSLSTQARQMRGAKRALCADFFTDDFGHDFQTILMLMNGIGIAGRLSGLPALLMRCKSVLAEGGTIIADSSDLRYLFEDDEDILSSDGYYGEVDFQMVYGPCKGKAFDWLYVDFDTLRKTAEQCGMKATLVKKGNHFDYLAIIK